MAEDSRAGVLSPSRSGARDPAQSRGDGGWAVSSPVRVVSEYQEIGVTPPLRFAPGGFALVTVTDYAFEVSGVTMDEKVAEQWVAMNPFTRRYTAVLVFSHDLEGSRP